MTRTSQPKSMRRARRIAVLAICLVTSMAFASTAAAYYWGDYHLDYGSCCGGAALNGTRAYIDVSSTTPDANSCLAHSSVVDSNSANDQTEAGLLRCGTNTRIDGTCSLTNNFVKFVELDSGGTYTCYPHGSATLGSSYLVTIDDSANNGSWYAYIAGTQYEGYFGLSSTAVNVYEWGEYTGGTCSGWSDSTSFSTWQRYYYAGSTWTTVASATNGTTGCWSVGSLSSGNFSVSH